MFQFSHFRFYSIYLLFLISKCYANDIIGCGGFVKSHVNLDFSKIEIGIYTKEGSLKEKTECAPTNGYYFLPLYEKGEYVLKVHPPAGWSFEPSQVSLSVDGVKDPCSTGQDINFSFNGFGITGRVITAGQSQGPAGISVQLLAENGDVRETVTTSGGDFHFTPVIPGKYTVKASHSRWKLDPAQVIVQVKEGNTALRPGALAVRGYDVSGSVTSHGSPIAGLYVLLYSKEANPKFRVEGCNTALLQGVPDSPICHSVTDASGEFTFGLVPAGEYRLFALNKAPGQATVSYNVKPDAVPFSVKHDSLYIKNAFEVTGFTVVGSVVITPSGNGLSRVRVLLDGEPVATTDSSGKYTLPALQAGTYALTFQHEHCEIDGIKASISQSGSVSLAAARVARWLVCGSIAPPAQRRVAFSATDGQFVAAVRPGNDGKWCTFLPPGTFTAKVEVDELDQRDELQFYPLSQTVKVASAPVSGISFSQLKAELTGRAICLEPRACEGLKVTLRPLSPDGRYVGTPVTTTADKEGRYSFSSVSPGSVEVSLSAGGACWRDATHNVAVAAARATVPAFVHTGYGIAVHIPHAVQVVYKSGKSQGLLDVPVGSSQQCVERAGRYTLTPRGCHRFKPPQVEVVTAADKMPSVNFEAIAHAVVVKVRSPVAVDDLVLNVKTDGQGATDVGPLEAKPSPDGGYVFEHTLYMAVGEVSVISAWSSSLLFDPSAPQQVVGQAQCQLDAFTLRATKGLQLTGKIKPPVAGVVVTVKAGECVRWTYGESRGGEGVELSQTTTEDGTYSFGPLDSTKHYTVSAEKESYAFGEPDDNGNIAAHKLAEIIVDLLDDANGTPLQGALVSVSGGAYRRNVVSGPDGKLRFSSLPPAEYYAKPLMKEYRFSPPHHILTLDEGRTHHIELRGVRVAWSCVGQLVSLGGVGWGGATVLAVPEGVPPSARCAPEEATTEHNGAFRIRGLLPNCVYRLQLKESTDSNLVGLKLVKSPSPIEIKENKDIENIRLIAVKPHQVTDVSVTVVANNVDHYRTLRLTLASENSPHTPLYSTKIDSTGLSAHLNPGLVYTLPRLVADNNTYVVQLESSLSKSTHTYSEVVQYFVSDAKHKHFLMSFEPKVKSTEQELRQSSILIVPLLGAIVLAVYYRDRLTSSLATLVEGAKPRPSPRPRPEPLDRAAIDQIVSSVNAAGKRVSKKKVQ